ncbi:hypothetical protein [Spirosoma telluris]|uniref:hypothetical protein n=1 Tax=Spirosoma telluris TaxID=2183553 RepID=UPI002FC2A4E9
MTVNRGNCVANAGSLTAINSLVCGGTSSGTVTVSATLNGGLVQPSGYSVLYLLAKGANHVIEQTSSAPTFTVADQEANYTIHTLVYDANPADKDYFDLSLIHTSVSKIGTLFN